MLTSLQNEQVKHIVALQKRKTRKDHGEFLIEGWRFVEEAVRRKAEIRQIYVCPEKEKENWSSLQDILHERRVAIIEVDEKVLRKMSDTEEPQGIIAVVGVKNLTWSDLEIDSQTVLLIVDGIQDPGNLGTILRTALAAGVHQVCLTAGTVDLYNPKVLRSTMGTVFGLKVLTDCSPQDVVAFVRSKSIKIMTGDIEGDSLYETKCLFPLALVVGNEGNGPSEVFRSPELTRVTLPMSNEVESLNVAVATGIILYEIARRKV
ncbi:TrmH family RNA methyltransferase [Desulfitobacterium sp. Sab5]|uniref:TrmH family RNA methyltransferase n=1 Tax=Desulfitobacterium nosdiversum TaxID=3375356 RepID=UPI003CEC739B